MDRFLSQRCFVIWQASRYYGDVSAGDVGESWRRGQPKSYYHPLLARKDDHLPRSKCRQIVYFKHKREGTSSTIVELVPSLLCFPSYDAASSRARIRAVILIKMIDSSYRQDIDTPRKIGL